MSAYVPQTWVDGVTAIMAANLDHMEQGIAAAHEQLAALEAPPSLSEEQVRQIVREEMDARFGPAA